MGGGGLLFGEGCIFLYTLKDKAMFGFNLGSEDPLKKKKRKKQAWETDSPPPAVTPMTPPPAQPPKEESFQEAVERGIDAAPESFVADLSKAKNTEQAIEHTLVQFNDFKDEEEARQRTAHNQPPAQVPVTPPPAEQTAPLISVDPKAERQAKVRERATKLMTLAQRMSGAGQGQVGVPPQRGAAPASEEEALGESMITTEGMGNPAKGGTSVNRCIKEAAGTAKDFLSNYLQMREANWKGGDKYFHCKANCQGSERGSAGAKTSEIISDTREWLDDSVKGTSLSGSAADQQANRHGRTGAGGPQDCSKVCAPYRPKGLPKKY